jgi:hypothetical protein
MDVCLPFSCLFRPDSFRVLVSVVDIRVTDDVMCANTCPRRGNQGGPEVRPCLAATVCLRIKIEKGKTFHPSPERSQMDPPLGS